MERVHLLHMVSSSVRFIGLKNCTDFFGVQIWRIRVKLYEHNTQYSNTTYIAVTIDFTCEYVSFCFFDVADGLIDLD